MKAIQPSGKSSWNAPLSSPGQTTSILADILFPEVFFAYTSPLDNVFNASFDSSRSDAQIYASQKSSPKPAASFEEVDVYSEWLGPCQFAM